MFDRRWAFMRRLQYGTGFAVFWILIFSFTYKHYFYVAPTCFDNSQNGGEAGVDCGGVCKRICAFSVIKPEATWARSFRVHDGQYNAVAYVENKNKIAASPEVAYTFSLFDAQGLIVERKGKTILPPDSVYPVFEARIDTQGRVPTQTFIKLEPVEVWLPANAGQDQFTVTNRKLSDADSTPKLEATIRNNKLTQADTIEVVATIFDAKHNALTSSRTFVDKVQPRSEATAVFTWPEPIAKTVRSCEIPTDVVLAIDLSGSMNNDGMKPPQPLTSVLMAAKSFVDRLRTADQVGVVTFATTATLVQSLTHDLKRVSDGVAQLAIIPKEETGSTNQGDAFIKVLDELNSSHHSKDARKVAILLTDGLATAPDKNPNEFAQQQAELLKQSGVTVFTIGLGKGVNMDFVKSLASSPTEAYQAISSNDVANIYRTITASLCEDGAAVIDIIPKSNASFQSLQ